MQYRCIRPFGAAVAGDVTDVPDGATVSPLFWEPLDATQSVPASPVAVSPAPAQPDAAQVAAASPATTPEGSI